MTFPWQFALLRDDDIEGSGGGGDDGGNDGGNAGGGNEGGGGGGGEKVPAWASELVGEFRKLTQMAEQARLERQNAANNSPAPVDPNEEEDDEETDPKDLELMDRADYAKHIINQVLKAMNKQVVAPLNQRLNEVAASATRTDIQAAVKEAAGQNKDFWDWREEMQAIVQQPQYRTLSPIDLYHLARSRNMDKAQKLDAKYNPKPKEAGAIRLKPFGGLTPSQTGTGSRSRKMNGHEAADAAWAEMVKAFGGEPLFEE